jgi:hypothetical protein
MKPMIDFSTIELNKLSKFLSTLSGNTDPTEYFEMGKIIEYAYQEYGKGQLKRINLIGKDLIDNFGRTYESKKIKFANKSQTAVRGVVVMNGRSTPDLSRFSRADYYIFTDPDKLKACCVPGEMLYNVKIRGTTITASCDPESEHFFLNGGPTLQENFFQKKVDFYLNYIREIEE